MMSPCRFQPAKGFTLVELLTVIVIIAALLAAFMPALSGFGRATRLTSAGDMVAALCNAARQTAVSKNTLAALVLLGAQGTPDDFRAFAILEYRADEGWVQQGSWERLPDEVIVDVSDPQNSSFLNNSPNPFPFADEPAAGTPPIFHQNRPVQGNAYAARIFLPHGGLHDSETPALIRLVEGHLQGSSIHYSQSTGAAGGPANYYDLAIIGATGQIKVTRPGIP